MKDAKTLLEELLSGHENRDERVAYYLGALQTKCGTVRSLAQKVLWPLVHADKVDEDLVCDGNVYEAMLAAAGMKCTAGNLSKAICRVFEDRKYVRKRDRMAAEVRSKKVDEAEVLKERVKRLSAENERNQLRMEQLQKENAQLQKENAQLQEDNIRMQKEYAQKDAKRENELRKALERANLCQREVEWKFKMLRPISDAERASQPYVLSGGSCTGTPTLLVNAREMEDLYTVKEMIAPLKRFTILNIKVVNDFPFEVYPDDSMKNKLTLDIEESRPRNDDLLRPISSSEWRFIPRPRARGGVVGACGVAVAARFAA